MHPQSLMPKKLIDIYFWFEHSTKRKNELRSFCDFCDQQYRKVIKHVSTRWLSLEIAIERCLKQYPSLKSYFLSNNEPQARFNRLHVAFEDPMTELHLLFFQSVLPIFTNANKFLQREEPLIYLLRSHLMSLFKKLLSKFVEPRTIAAAGDDVHLVDFESNQLGNEKLVIGFSYYATYSKIGIQCLLISEKFFQNHCKIFAEMVSFF